MLLALAACDTSVTPQELLAQQESGVVMVRNDFYYELRLPNGESLYFKHLDERGNLVGLTGDEDEIKNDMSVATGTGFFVDENGGILTNRHVASPELDKVQVRRSFRNIIKEARSILSELSAAIVSTFNELESKKNDCYVLRYNVYTNDYDTYVDQAALNEIEQQQQECRNDFAECQEAIENLEDNMDPESYEIRAISKLSIAYNNTYASDRQDFVPCELVRSSRDEETDLALLSLKNRKTPSRCYVFTTASRRSDVGSPIDRVKRMLDKDAHDTEVHVNKELHMIGFNAGPMLGNTRQGLKAQITTGRVTQEPDGDRVLYDIATMKGSSGSPVVDNYGNLVAVNFAKMGGSDNFNFGIPLEKINAFMHWH